MKEVERHPILDSSQAVIKDTDSSIVIAFK